MNALHQAHADAVGRQQVIQIIGERFGRFVVVSRAPNDRYQQARWNCVCDCGTTKVVLGCALRAGHSKSCGCYRTDLVTKHGNSNRPEYRILQNMIQRCTNPKQTHYSYYGARGISVCEQWRGPGGFDAFFAEVGPRPSPHHSIDRFPDNDGNYEPGNVRWATRKEQSNNRRAQRSDTRARGERNGQAKLTADAVLEIRAMKLPKTELAARFGVDITTVNAVLSRRSWFHV